MNTISIIEKHSEDLHSKIYPEICKYLTIKEMCNFSSTANIPSARDLFIEKLCTNLILKMMKEIGCPHNPELSNKTFLIFQEKIISDIAICRQFFEECKKNKETILVNDYVTLKSKEIIGLKSSESSDCDRYSEMIFEYPIVKSRIHYLVKTRINFIEDSLIQYYFNPNQSDGLLHKFQNLLTIEEKKTITEFEEAHKDTECKICLMDSSTMYGYNN